jgi:hypothetical protein
MLNLVRRWQQLGVTAADFTFRRVFKLELGYDVATWLRVHGRADRVLAVTRAPDGTTAVIRSRHLDHSALVRPDPREPWQLEVQHDHGRATLNSENGLHVAGKLLAVLNGPGSAESAVRFAIGKLEDAQNPDGYFARVAAIAMRCWWGRFPYATTPIVEEPAATEAERLALSLTKRSFWGRGGIGSEPRTPLPRLPLVDRLALEMAANEDTERRALEGELYLLEAAWRQAEEIAAIADGMFNEMVSVSGTGFSSRLSAISYRLSVDSSPAIDGSLRAVSDNR